MKLSRFVSLFVVMALGLGFVASHATAQEVAPETATATITNTVGDTEFVPGTNGTEGGETVDPDGPTQPSGPTTPVGTTMPGNSGPQQFGPGNLNQPTVPQGPSVVVIPQENDGGTDPVDPGGPTNPTNGGGNGGGSGGGSGSSGGGSIIPVVPFTAAQVEALRLQALSILNGISNLPQPTNTTIAANAAVGGTAIVDADASADVSSTDVSANTEAEGNSNVAAAASAIDGTSFFSKLWNGIVTVVTYIPKKVMSLFN